MKVASAIVDRSRVARAFLTLFVVVGTAPAAFAQIPGAPILQNAWTAPGLVGAVNVGGGSDGTVFAVAAAWSPASGRFQLSGGGGIQSRSSSETSSATGSRGVYGVRAAVPLGGAASSVGFALFAGIGGGRGGKTAFPDSVSSTMEVPLGVAVGWRRVIGGTHGISVYATPAYVLYSGGTKNSGLVRGSIGADVGITQALGATLGIEMGGTRPRGYGGPSGVLYGLGVSYALGRR